MPPTEESEWEKARRALIKLEHQFLSHPAVSMMDIGYDPGEEASQRLVLRVHLRQPLVGLALDLPSEIDGIPVRLIRGDYHLE